jgi:hypothetical protein
MSLICYTPIAGASLSRTYFVTPVSSRPKYVPKELVSQLQLNLLNFREEVCAEYVLAFHTHFNDGIVTINLKVLLLSGDLESVRGGGLCQHCLE